MITAESFKDAKLLVAGDVMLDRYWFGDAERISPEAPVPVVRVAYCEERLGGAGNVALNMAKLGADVGLCAIVGDDEPGNTLKRLLSTQKIRQHLLVDPHRPTTVKLRIVARQQQMVRCDFEESREGAPLMAPSVMDQLLESTDTLVLSDYGKGALQPIAPLIKAARDRGLRVLVDPKGDDFEPYRGATFLTPNRTELARIVGHWKSEAQLTELAQNLRTHLDLPYLLLTRSEEGMTLYSDEGVFTVPAQAREVFDVSGAGDTVIAVLATSLAAGASLYDAVTLANRAGGIVVGKLGTAPITLDELFRTC